MRLMAALGTREEIAFHSRTEESLFRYNWFVGEREEAGLYHPGGTNIMIVSEEGSLRKSVNVHERDKRAGDDFREFER